MPSPVTPWGRKQIVSFTLSQQGRKIASTLSQEHGLAKSDLIEVVLRKAAAESWDLKLIKQQLLAELG